MDSRIDRTARIASPAAQDERKERKGGGFAEKRLTYPSFDR